jgi:hypothetical protein
MLPFVDKKVGEDGRITDETAKKLVKALLQELVAWTKKLQG